MAKIAQGKAETKVSSKRKRVVKYFRDVISEVKKVSWPDRKELVNATIAAIVFIVIFAIVVGIVDLILGQLLKLIT
ncbi:preprotein translocase subunit SecE [Caldicoprobacter algeriensis]|uniref:preprotein translocase subunit SecE n=1 Tax=Caldicoprobacter algeriensis TaxID=699281 RepID=UPI002079357F|nr:preprotein translocase subunit SecE [Caldicoprobacter algeriensis]MCM8900401.1 preprotein translocase subunit SecE [Caldicoprobacter algeriensis]